MRNNLCHTPISRTGFSLVELSVVLVIVGLLAGSISVGNSMMNAAEIRGIATRAHEYIAAIDDFHDKYDAFPGDMTNATNLWGAATTTNGNGDRTIGRSTAQNAEIFLAWQHLSLGGFITGNFTGVAGVAGTSQALVGTNVPQGKIGRSGYDITYIEDSAIPAAYYTGLTYRHVIHYGLEVAGDNFARGTAISASKAYGIDNKIDDGKPATGSLMTYNNTTHPNCASTDIATTAIYQKANATGLDIYRWVLGNATIPL